MVAGVERAAAYEPWSKIVRRTRTAVESAGSNAASLRDLEAALNAIQNDLLQRRKY